jgi:hypothetical protein
MVTKATVKAVGTVGFGLMCLASFKFVYGSHVLRVPKVITRTNCTPTLSSMIF